MSIDTTDIISRLLNTETPTDTSGQRWWLYMVLADDQKLYSGVTTEPLRRFRQHRGELAGGAKFFRGRRAQSLEYLRPVANRSEAQQLEAQLKKLNRQQKLALIAEADHRHRNRIRTEAGDGS